MNFETFNTRRIFRKLGYFGDQSGIERRYRRERENWDPHLQNTRHYTLESAKDKKKQSAAVLGSGWLLDVPLEELAGLFGKVTLMDIRHPGEVKKRIKPMNNVELCVCDISGFAHPVYRYTKQYRNKKDRPPISVIQPQNGLDLTVYDFVFSCNILSQLDILLVDYLSEFFDLNDEETIDFRRNIQQRHISLLPRNRSCLVADYEEMIYSSSDEEMLRKPLVYHEIVQNPDAERWTWKFDTRMTYYAGKKTHFNVMGVEI